FEFTPPGAHRKYVAVANPLRLEAGKNKGIQFGDLVVAKPRTELTHRLLTLVDRLAIAFLGGIVVAGLLAWYLSRRITKPVRAVRAARRRRPRPREARDEPLHRAERGGRHGAPLRPGVRGLRRGGPPTQHRVRPPFRREADDRLRRRPGLADHLQPALERVS